MRLCDMTPEARRAEIALTQGEVFRAAELAVQFKRAVAYQRAREAEIMRVLSSPWGREMIKSIAKGD
jgi:hypothetical protein